MAYEEKTKVVSFSAIVALAGLLIVIISAHALFSEIVFYSIILILISVIVILVAYAFLWWRIARYISHKLRKRKHDSLAQLHFDDFREFVERFTSLGEFRNVSLGITGILERLTRKSPPVKNSVLINERIKIFGTLLQSPLNNFKQKLDNLRWNRKEVKYEFLSSIVREFENYVRLHKQLYVDFAVLMADEIKNLVPEVAKRTYADYKVDYNQFVIAYTEFAKRCSREGLGIFSDHLEKAREL